VLEDLSTLARTYGDDSLRQDVAFIIDQASSQTASVAVLGQFKRGKSTLLNALLGEDVLPTGRLPLTGATTRIVHGDVAELHVHYCNGSKAKEPVADLAKFVTEERNPRNRLGVAYVDVALPLPMLRDMTLIDTPGIGSTLVHNTQAAREASERVDLALFVTGPEPPITSDELAFLRQVQDAADRVIVVVSKIDVVPGGETEILTFTRETISEVLHHYVPLYAVDGTRRDERVAALRDAIIRTVAENGGDLARRSQARRVRRIASQIRRSLDLRRAAALLPAAERERARALFAELAQDVEERGADLVRSIEHFPTEEIVSVDALLETLVQQAAEILSAQVGRFVAQGAGEGERALYECIAAHEAQWSDQVASSLQEHIDKRKRSALRLLAELERRFAQAGNKALGLPWVDAVEDEPQEFGAREAATRMSGPVPTTGLELMTGGVIATLPAPLRSRVLRKRYGSLATELLDRSKGRVRSAAVRYLLEWRLANVGLVRDRLVAARRVVEEAFESASDAADDANVRARMQKMERDEQILDAVATAFG